MSKVVFYYFSSKGIGESCRTLMAYGGQEFEDRRIPWKDWPEFKPSKTLANISRWRVNELSKVYVTCFDVPKMAHIFIILLMLCIPVTAVIKCIFFLYFLLNYLGQNERDSCVDTFYF